mmetsp:Transcript_11709/g.26542  ORF Transcript_11709/g.26542 Transcript_11709/m.26542 type:complete len:253 (-) Transcript_11709:257-1015(-)
MVRVKLRSVRRLARLRLRLALLATLQDTRIVVAVIRIARSLQMRKEGVASLARHRRNAHRADRLVERLERESEAATQTNRIAPSCAGASWRALRVERLKKCLEISHPFLGKLVPSDVNLIEAQHQRKARKAIQHAARLQHVAHECLRSSAPWRVGEEAKHGGKAVRKPLRDNGSTRAPREHLDLTRCVDKDIVKRLLLFLFLLLGFSTCFSFAAAAAAAAVSFVVVRRRRRRQHALLHEVNHLVETRREQVQ